MKRRNFINVLVVCGLFTYLFANCSDKNETGDDNGTAYDPSKPLTANSFSPDSGGFATRVIIEGSNFGNNPKDVRVWFNNKQASVIGTNGDHLYAIAPRTPGDTCTVSVAVGNDSTVLSKPFMYRISTTIVTIAGKPGTSLLKPGTLAEAEFAWPRQLCVDSKGNVYGNNWRMNASGPQCAFVLNEEENYVKQLPGDLYKGGTPTIDAEERFVIIPADSYENYFTYNIELQWSSRTYIILHPTPEDTLAGHKDFTSIRYKHSFATCQLDGMVYTYSYLTGSLIRFNPSTRVGELVVNLQVAEGRMCFHPVDKEILYIAYHTGAIYSYNILTGEYKHVAGTLGITGYRDGPCEDALFRSVGQLIFDDNLDIIFTDPSNHCIRKIDMKKGYVSTLIGKGGVQGYQDGNPDDALFYQPFGICIDKDYNIYIADTYNNCIRKLVIQ
jgi:hypothetical protein